MPSDLNLDHFKCYDAKNEKPKFQKLNVFLSDQFEDKDTKVIQPELICNPVDKNGEGINNPTAHLTCYRIEDVSDQPEFEERDVIINDQFGELTFEVKRPKLLCVPTEKTDLGPSDDQSEDDDEENEFDHDGWHIR